MVPMLRAQNSCEPSRLLALPPELRNRIWHHILPSEIKLSRDHRHPAPPPIARSCRQVRKECIGIFLTTSMLALRIVDHDSAWTLNVIDDFASIFNSALQMGALESDRTHSIQPIMLGFSGRPNWPNLLRSLKARHEARSRSLTDMTGGSPASELPPNVAFAMTADRIASSMREKPWGDVETVLRSYRDVVLRFDAAWA